jgi:hypothetical protein
MDGSLEARTEPQRENLNSFAAEDLLTPYDGNEMLKADDGSNARAGEGSTDSGLQLATLRRSAPVRCSGRKKLPLTAKGSCSMSAARDTA